MGVARPKSYPWFLDRALHKAHGDQQAPALWICQGVHQVSWLPMLFWWIFILPAWISQCNCFLSLAEDEVKDKKTNQQPLRETGRASRLQSKKQEKDKEEKEDKEENESKEEDNGNQQNRASRRKNYQRKNRDGKKAREEGSQKKDRGKKAPTKDQKESENKDKKTTKRGKEGENKQKKDRKNR